MYSNSLITPEFKDQVLTNLLEICELGEEFDYDSESDTLFPSNTPNNIKDAVLDYFFTMGLIQWYPQRYNETSDFNAVIILTMNAIDFVHRGGFVGQEKLFHDNIKKLLLELDDLKPSAPEKFERISSIIGNISSFLSILVR